MGILRVALVDENGRTVQSVGGDPHVLDPLLEGVPAKSGVCVGFIDPYGDTVFNTLQMDAFLAEWETIESGAVSPKTQAVAKSVRELAQRCQAEVHLYLKFTGD